jgi:SAM-dependent methyltransferase
MLQTPAPIVPTQNSYVKNESLLQRKYVWTYLQQQFPDDKPIRILELHCGIGEDALYLTKLGHRVLATDPSIHNLKLAQETADKWKFPERPEFRQLGLGSIHADRIKEKFDLIFTNFGGLNTLDKKGLERLAMRFPRLLKPGGRVIAVVMPKQHLWDFFDAENRNRKQEKESELKAYYHSPETIKSIFAKRFHFQAQQPIGVALPPAQLEKKYKRRKRLIKTLNKWEKKLNQFSFLAGLSDHYLVDFELK